MNKHPTYVFREADDMRHRLIGRILKDPQEKDSPASQADLLRVLEWVTELALWAVQKDRERR